MRQELSTPKEIQWLGRWATKHNEVAFSAGIQDVAAVALHRDPVPIEWFTYSATYMDTSLPDYLTRIGRYLLALIAGRRRARATRDGLMGLLEEQWPVGSRSGEVADLMRVPLVIIEINRKPADSVWSDNDIRVPNWQFDDEPANGPPEYDDTVDMTSSHEQYEE